MRLTRTVYRAHYPKWAFVPESGDAEKLANPLPEFVIFRTPDGCRKGRKTEKKFFASFFQKRRKSSFLKKRSKKLLFVWKDLATRGIRPPSWTLTDRLIAAGIAGIVVPSFAHGAGASDSNAVFWRWSGMPPHQVRVVDPLGRLPRDDRSWT